MKVDLETFNKLKEEHSEKSRTASEGMFKGGLADQSEITTALHSTCHLMLAGMRKILGEGVNQAGSNINSERLRFDFTYSGKILDNQVIEVEDYVNSEINNGNIVSTEIMPIDKAREIGAMALFSEKYGDMVRVVKMGKSIELCGGTHVSNTKDIHSFAIFNLESKGSNVF